MTIHLPELEVYSKLHGFSYKVIPLDNDPQNKYIYHIRIFDFSGDFHLPISVKPKINKLIFENCENLTIDLSNCRELRTIVFIKSSIRGLLLYNVPKLSEIKGGYFMLKSEKLDLSDFNLSSVEMIFLDAKCLILPKAIIRLDIGGSTLEDIDISKSSNLIDLIISNSRINNLLLPKNNSLRYISVRCKQKLIKLVSDDISQLSYSEGLAII